jgi:glyoxylase-like metal-dependent hydrolase (beta-lactamase superfamily II)
VIDPGDEADRILGALRRLDLTLVGILHTHAHLDHVGATEPVARATGASVMLHPGDQMLYDRVDVQAQMFGFPVPGTIPVDHHVHDGEAIPFGQRSGEILHTPGHTPGSLCLRLDRGAAEQPPVLFAGDTLFLGSIGRTDLWGGDMDQILRSIEERLLTLPDETLVVPGHGPPTTIGRERRGNPFLQR